MREYEFRGQDKNGNWHYRSLVLATDSWYHPKGRGGFHREWIAERTFSNGGFINLAVRYCVKPETVGQYTGLKDKNGTKIYEGDIVLKHDLTFNRKHIGVVIYNPAIACYRIEENSNGFTYRHDFVASDNYNDGKCTVSCKYEYEVLGNVFDNQELLKNK